MTEIVKVEKKRVLEPTEVLPPLTFTHREYGISFRMWNPSSEMRALGYTANPDICRHRRKAYQPRFGWWCRDCGDSLKRA